LTKVLILGNNGMLGSATERIFRADPNVKVETSSRSGNGSNHAFDVLTGNISDLVESTSPEYIINCIGVIKPRIDDKNAHSVSDALKVNSLFPHELHKATIGSSIKVIQIATDCVYSGSRGSYSESDPHDALDVYGKTKSLGEVNSSNFLNIRVSIIGPEKGRSTSLLEWFLNQPQNASLSGYANHLWNGISTFHFARIALGLIKRSSFNAGSVHLLPKGRVSKFELLQIFRDTYDRNDLQISEVHPENIVDRTLATQDERISASFWRNAGYQAVPNIRQIVTEMKSFNDDLP